MTKRVKIRQYEQNLDEREKYYQNPLLKTVQQLYEEEQIARTIERE